MQIDNKVKGATLKKLRKELGMNIKQMMDAADVGETTYIRIEGGGNCRAETLEDIIVLGLGMRVSTFYRAVETRMNDDMANSFDDEDVTEYLCTVSDSIVKLFNSQEKFITKLTNYSETPRLKRLIKHIKKNQ